MIAKSIERIESKRVEKFLKFFLILSVLSFAIALLKIIFKPEILLGKGSLADYLISFSPVLLYYEYYRKSKKWKGLFIEWSDNSIAFKTRNHDTTSIAYASIKNIDINLDSILIKSKPGKLYQINLEDFTAYEERIKIKENFAKIEILE